MDKRNSKVIKIYSNSFIDSTLLTQILAGRDQLIATVDTHNLMKSKITKDYGQKIKKGH